MRHLAPVTFDTKADAAAWLDMRHAELLEHRWKPPARVEPGTVLFKNFAQDWLAGRELSPSTRAEYQRMINGRLAWFADMSLAQITPAKVKTWWTNQGDRYPTARRKAYDLMHTILDSATRPDEDTDAPPLLGSNPARLSTKTLRAGGGHSRRIKPATLTELGIIMTEMPDRYASMVALAAWCAPRFGELTELRRKDVSFERDAQGVPVAGTLHISRAVVWADPDTPVVKEPKSAAGIRDVSIPPHVIPLLVDHLEKFAQPGPDGLLFPAVESGGHMKHGALYKVFRRARAKAGRPDLRWHDLRHTGATMAAQAGATLRELMNRLGHSDVRAALIYQHAAEDRDKALADALSRMAEGGQ
ncbi:MAG: tyrosine-type recombinase/integrase [Brooklawnia sp.]